MKRRDAEIAEKKRNSASSASLRFQSLLPATNRLAEAEPLIRRALAIDEQSYGAEHPEVAVRLWVLAVLLRDTDRLDEVLPLIERAFAIYRRFESQNGYQHPDWDKFHGYYRRMRKAAGLSDKGSEA